MKLTRNTDSRHRRNGQDYNNEPLTDHLKPFLVFPHECMRVCGPAAQTWSGFILQGHREVYKPISVIAEACGLPPRTVKYHIPILIEHGWLERGEKGRRRTQTYIPRRIRFSDHDDSKFAALPAWLGQFMTWAERAYLACVVSRYFVGIENYESEGDAEYAQDRGISVLTHKAIMAKTGLRHQAARKAREGLLEREWIQDINDGYQPESRIGYTPQITLNLEATIRVFSA